MTEYGVHARREMQRKLNIERRKKHLRRLYYHTIDATATFLWIVAVFLFGFLAILVYGLWPR